MPNLAQPQPANPASARASQTPETAGTSIDDAPGGDQQPDLPLARDLQAIARACLPPEAARAFTPALATKFARMLHQRIGGSYITKEASRTARNLAVLQAFDGRNHDQVRIQFGISRALLYNIIAWGRSRK